MKLRYICLHVTSLLIAFGTSTSAQTTIIRDAVGKHLPFISMALTNARDTSLVKGTISKETGGYVFETIKPGQYRLIASGVVYTSTRTKPFDVTTSSQKCPPLP
ncbi:carboxypeptidase-like regulatory domain-containing protein [Spirosoma sp.]|uniref:carboxypeptidase-like regulatory domain-containing protein n=1 Tax=Spirosoma sp. TaxID=1899569 RepID=UPI00261B315A|nr:carboxypeptidase-like regulatory domain-containing protein [Spirosoma sp.]MCX6215428.1 carboxypeptidase-like regulatory domain-containing protein [Spirosoma sp.]